MASQCHLHLDSHQASASSLRRRSVNLRLHNPRLLDQRQDLHSDSHPVPRLDNQTQPLARTTRANTEHLRTQVPPALVQLRRFLPHLPRRRSLWSQNLQIRCQLTRVRISEDYHWVQVRTTLRQKLDLALQVCLASLLSQHLCLANQRPHLPTTSNRLLGSVHSQTTCNPWLKASLRSLWNPRRPLRLLDRQASAP